MPTHANAAVMVRLVATRVHSVRGVAQIFGVSPQTVYKWMRRYREGGRAVLENRSCVPHRTQRKYPLPTPEAKQQLFATLHAPPSEQGLNRTTWRIPDLVDALRSKGVMVNEPFYSARKNTGEILLLLDRLIREYADRRTLFLTWNAAP